jgi:hypothetical protein
MHGRQAFVVANQTGDDLDATDIFSDPASRWRISQQVLDTWPEFEQKLPHLERVVLYLGTAGCQSVVVQALGYPPRSALFLTTTQHLSSKLFMLALAGFIPEAHRMDCEPGGRDSMLRLLYAFLQAPAWFPGS